MWRKGRQEENPPTWKRVSECPDSPDQQGQCRPNTSESSHSHESVPHRRLWVCYSKELNEANLETDKHTLDMQSTAHRSRVSCTTGAVVCIPWFSRYSPRRCFWSASPAGPTAGRPRSPAPPAPRSSPGLAPPGVGTPPPRRPPGWRCGPSSWCRPRRGSWRPPARNWRRRLGRPVTICSPYLTKKIN